METKLCGEKKSRFEIINNRIKFSTKFTFLLVCLLYISCAHYAPSESQIRKETVYNILQLVKQKKANEIKFAFAPGQFRKSKDDFEYLVVEGSRLINEFGIPDSSKWTEIKKQGTSINSTFNEITVPLIDSTLKNPDIFNAEFQFEFMESIGNKKVCNIYLDVLYNGTPLEK